MSALREVVQQLEDILKTSNQYGPFVCLDSSLPVNDLPVDTDDQCSTDDVDLIQTTREASPGLLQRDRKIFMSRGLGLVPQVDNADKVICIEDSEEIGPLEWAVNGLASEGSDDIGNGMRNQGAPAFRRQEGGTVTAHKPAPSMCEVNPLSDTSLQNCESDVPSHENGLDGKDGIDKVNETVEVVQPMKRKRGRPKKIIDPNLVINVVKRPRGRPRKIRAIDVEIGPASIDQCCTLPEAIENQESLEKDLFHESSTCVVKVGVEIFPETRQDFQKEIPSISNTNSNEESGEVGSNMDGNKDDQDKPDHPIKGKRGRTRNFAPSANVEMHVDDVCHSDQVNRSETNEVVQDEIFRHDWNDSSEHHFKDKPKKNDLWEKQTAAVNNANGTALGEQECGVDCQKTTEQCSITDTSLQNISESSVRFDKCVIECKNLEENKDKDQADHPTKRKVGRPRKARPVKVFDMSKCRPTASVPNDRIDQCYTLSEQIENQESLEKDLIHDGSSCADEVSLEISPETPMELEKAIPSIPNTNGDKEYGVDQQRIAGQPSTIDTSLQNISESSVHLDKCGIECKSLEGNKDKDQANHPTKRKVGRPRKARPVKVSAMSKCRPTASVPNDEIDQCCTLSEQIENQESLGKDLIHDGSSCADEVGLEIFPDTPMELEKAIPSIPNTNGDKEYGVDQQRIAGQPSTTDTSLQNISESSVHLDKCGIEWKSLEGNKDKDQANHPTKRKVGRPRKARSVKVSAMSKCRPTASVPNDEIDQCCTLSEQIENQESLGKDLIHDGSSCADEGGLEIFPETPMELEKAIPSIPNTNGDKEYGVDQQRKAGQPSTTDTSLQNISESSVHLDKCGIEWKSLEGNKDKDQANHHTKRKVGRPRKAKPVKVSAMNVKMSAFSPSASVPNDEINQCCTLSEQIENQEYLEKDLIHEGSSCADEVGLEISPEKPMELEKAIPSSLNTNSDEMCGVVGSNIEGNKDGDKPDHPIKKKRGRPRKVPPAANVEIRVGAVSHSDQVNHCKSLNDIWEKQTAAVDNANGTTPQEQLPKLRLRRRIKETADHSSRTQRLSPENVQSIIPIEYAARERSPVNSSPSSAGGDGILQLSGCRPKAPPAEIVEQVNNPMIHNRTLRDEEAVSMKHVEAPKRGRGRPRKNALRNSTLKKKGEPGLPKTLQATEISLGIKCDAIKRNLTGKDQQEDLNQEVEVMEPDHKLTLSNQKCTRISQRHVTMQRDASVACPSERDMVKENQGTTLAIGLSAQPLQKDEHTTMLALNGCVKKPSVCIKKLPSTLIARQLKLENHNRLAHFCQQARYAHQTTPVKLTTPLSSGGRVITPYGHDYVQSYASSTSQKTVKLTYGEQDGHTTKTGNGTGKCLSPIKNRLKHPPLPFNSVKKSNKGKCLIMDRIKKDAALLQGDYFQNKTIPNKFGVVSMSQMAKTKSNSQKRGRSRRQKFVPLTTRVKQQIVEFRPQGPLFISKHLFNTKRKVMKDMSLSSKRIHGALAPEKCAPKKRGRPPKKHVEHFRSSTSEVQSVGACLIGTKEFDKKFERLLTKPVDSGDALSSKNRMQKGTAKAACMKIARKVGRPRKNPTLAVVHVPKRKPGRTFKPLETQQSVEKPLGSHPVSQKSLPVKRKVGRPRTRPTRLEYTPKEQEKPCKSQDVNDSSVASLVPTSLIKTLTRKRGRPRKHPREESHPIYPSVPLPITDNLFGGFGFQPAAFDAFAGIPSCDLALPIEGAVHPGETVAEKEEMPILESVFAPVSTVGAEEESIINQFRGDHVKGDAR